MENPHQYQTNSSLLPSPRQKTGPICHLSPLRDLSAHFFQQNQLGSCAHEHAYHEHADFFFLTIVNSSCITFYRLTVHYITVKTVDWSNRPWSVPILKINQLSENNVEKFNRDFTYNLNFSYLKSQHNDSTLLKCNYWRTISTPNFGFVNTQYQYLDNMQRLNSSLLSSYTDAILSEGMATCLHGQKLSEKEENGTFSS